MDVLFSRLPQETARAYALALASMGIPSTVGSSGSFWTVSVQTSQRQNSVETIALYRQENPPQSPRQLHLTPPGVRSYSAVYVGAVLVLIQAMIAPGYEHQVFVSALGADAGRILDGELYRCVTALLLHADWAHMVGNLAALALFGTVVAAHFGWGMGWLLILCGGGAGNLMTAWWYQQQHLAVGASTAVFAGVGLCSALSLHLRARRGSRSWRSWLPLAGGVALLGFLGTSPRSDLMAHLFGFLCGLLLGWTDLRFRHGRRWPFELAAACFGTGVVAACWFWGVLYSG